MGKKIACHDVNNKLYKADISDIVFRPSVYGILIEKQRILFSKQWDGFDFPGGGIEIWENIESALQREVWEETGLKVRMDKIVHCEASFFKPSRVEEFWNCQLIYYLVKKIGGELSKDNFAKDEKKYVDMPEWVDLKNINKIKFYNPVDSVKLIKKAVKVLKSKN